MLLYAIFYLICFFSINEDVTKQNWLENSIIFQNFYNRVSFSWVTSLQFSDSNFTIKRTHHRFFLEYVSKTNVLKRIFWEKTLCLTSNLIKLQSRCSTDVMAMTRCRDFQVAGFHMFYNLNTSIPAQMIFT